VNGFNWIGLENLWIEWIALDGFPNHPLTTLSATPEQAAKADKSDFLFHIAYSVSLSNPFNW